MSMVVNTNIASMHAQRSLMHSAKDLQTAMERLSSGKKINSSADDAAGFAIAERMTAQVRGLNMAVKNANDGLAMMAVIENSTSQISEILQRVRELAVQAASGTNSSSDKQNLQLEADALLSEIDRVAFSTTYNGMSILDGSQESLNVQVGVNDADTVQIGMHSLRGVSLGVGGRLGVVDYAWQDNAGTDNDPSDDKTMFGIMGELEFYEDVKVGDTVSVDGFEYEVLESQEHAPENTEIPDWHSDAEIEAMLAQGSEQQVLVLGDLGLDLQSKYGEWRPIEGQTVYLKTVDLISDAGGALTKISSAIDNVSSFRSEYGALQNRLGYVVSNLMNVAENTTAAQSRIRDADFAVESARLAKAQVLQQTGTAMLAQANAQPQMILSLIR